MKRVIRNRRAAARALPLERGARAPCLAASAILVSLALLLSGCGGTQGGASADATAGVGGGEAAQTAVAPTPGNVGEAAATAETSGQADPTATGAGTSATATGAGTSVAAGGATTVSIADITSNPAAYIGKVVTVQAQAAEVYNANSLRLADGTAAGEGGLPVVSAEQSRPVIDEDLLTQEVQVTGTLVALDQASIEQELGYTLDPALLTEWQGGPVLVADAIVPVP